MATNYDITSPLAKLQAIGCPYHGFAESGVLHLPASTVATLDTSSGNYYTPNGTKVIPVSSSPVGSSWGIQDNAKYNISGTSFPVKKPGIAAVSRTPSQVADDAINGKRWLNYTYLVNGKIYSTSLALSSMSWLYFDSVGLVWSIVSKLTIGFSSSTSRVSGGIEYSRFGRMPKAVDTPKHNRGVVDSEVGLTGYPTAPTFSGAVLLDVSEDGSKAIMAVPKPFATGYMLQETNNSSIVSIFLVEITDNPGTPVEINGLTHYPDADLVFTITPLKTHAQTNIVDYVVTENTFGFFGGRERNLDLVYTRTTTNHTSARFVRPDCVDVEYTKIELVENYTQRDVYTGDIDSLTGHLNIERRIKVYGYEATPMLDLPFFITIDKALFSSASGTYDVSINLNGSIYTGSTTTSALTVNIDGDIEFTFDSPVPDLIWFNPYSSSDYQNTALEFRIQPNDGSGVSRTLIFLYSDKGPFALGYALLDYAGQLPAIGGDFVVASILEWKVRSIYGTHICPDTTISVIRRINPPLVTPYFYQLSKSYSHAIDIVNNIVVPFRESACCFI